jgi:hypothetical protein
MTKTFEPAEHLTRLQGKDYLEVKWRLVWFRKAAPLGSIETECLYHDHERALFRATVRMNTIQMDDGSLVKDVPCVATGHGSEHVKDFRDYIEKAETKAIGRALAALGFGTQFAPDIDDGSGGGRVVDSPVQPKRGTKPRPEPKEDTNAPAALERITDRQVTWIKGQAARAGLDPDALAVVRYNAHLTALNVAQAKDLSTHLDEMIARKAKGNPNGSKVSQPQLAKMMALANEKGKTDADIHAFIAVFDKVSRKDLTSVEASAVIDWLAEQPDVAQQAGMPDLPEEPNWMRNADYSRTP